MENSSSRETRRKRILTGGSDRMALITGTIQSLPPPPSSSSRPLLSSVDDHIHVPQSNLPDQIPVGLAGDASVASLPRNVIDNESFKASNPLGIGSKDVTQVPEVEKSVKEEQEATVGEATNEMQQFPDTSIVQKTSATTKRHSKLNNQRRNSLTPKQISSCIMSSEATRIICSLMIALLVVLSYVDRPLLGRNLVRSESIVASRPFYILLLTDLTIMFARLTLERRRGLVKDKEQEEEEEERMAPHEEDGHSWASAIKVLETGLVVYQSICAVFMDFCVYAVVVICGLSFV